jgi:hypothetical protein
LGARNFQVMVENENKGYLRLHRITESMTNQNYLKLTLAFQSLGDKPINGEYRVQFFTENGLPVGDPLGWNPISLIPEETKYEEVTAPNENAYYYKITVKGTPAQQKY